MSPPGRRRVKAVALAALGGVPIVVGAEWNTTIAGDLIIPLPVLVFLAAACSLREGRFRGAILVSTAWWGSVTVAAYVSNFPAICERDCYLSSFAILGALLGWPIALVVGTLVAMGAGHIGGLVANWRGSRGR